jgi:hypothetical protein
MGKPEKKRPLGRPRHRSEDNIKMDLTGEMVWIGLIWLRIGTSGNEPLGSIKCWEILE